MYWGAKMATKSDMYETLGNLVQHHQEFTKIFKLSQKEIVGWVGFILSA